MLPYRGGLNVKDFYGIVPSVFSKRRFVGVLDGFSTVTLAYSVRKLRKAYTGDCVLLREDNGNTERAFGFTSAGLVDTSAIAAWITASGATNAYVKTWYDQSGLGYDATQTTNANQPLFVTSSAGMGGRPTLTFDSTDFFTTPAVDLTAYNQATALAVANIPAGVSTRIILEMGVNGYSQSGFFLALESSEVFSMATRSVLGGAGATWASLATAHGSAKSLVATFDMSLPSGECTGYINGISAGNRTFDGNNTGVYPSKVCYIGARAGTGSYLAGDLSELILLPDALATADRLFIIGDQSLWYSLGF